MYLQIENQSPSKLREILCSRSISEQFHSKEFFLEQGFVFGSQLTYQIIYL